MPIAHCHMPIAAFAFCCSHCITLDKRLLIEGEGGLGESSIDQRANVPTFRIVR